MKKFFLLLLLSLFVYAQNGIDFSSNILQGSGITAKKTVKLTPFKKIKADVSFNVVIQKDDTYEYIIQADDNLIDVIDVKVHDDVLIIKSKQSYQTNSGIKLSIKTKKLESLIVEGSSDIELKKLHENKLFMDIEGSVNVQSSAGSINNLTLKIDGAYDIDLSQLNVKNAEVNMQGSGDLKMNVTNQLNAEISDNASLLYSGTATVTKKISDNGYLEKN